jgi:hypothetical protein
MSVQASCPVFRCPKTSISQCTGYRRTCERYYCQTHTRGTLCDRCAGIKQEDMKSSYREMLNSLERKSYSASLTVGVVALLIISVLLIVIAIICANLRQNNESLLIASIILLLAGASGILVSSIWYWMKVREYMRAESIELDLKYPGFYDLYQQRQAKIDENTSSYY